MSSPLPPDPYRALGVDKSATSAEIRSAYRKLVLKCHPDKVKEPTLKAIKQEEFQKVQQAYELLNDDNKRVQYDEQVKLFELRREMGRGNPTSRSNAYEYDVRTAEPRSAPYSSPRPKDSPNAYARPMPRSYEDPSYAEPRSARKSASYESARDEELRRERKAQAAAEEERYRAKLEKEAKRAAHSKREKTRDKEKKRGTEEKFRNPYAEDADSDEYSHTPPKADKKSTRRMEEEIRMRNEEARERDRERERERDHEPILTAKWDDHKEYAAQYMQAARAKGMEKSKEGFPSMRRAETFTASPSYSVRYASHSAVPPPAPSPYPASDDDTPRRSSARSSSRRPSETPGRSREKSRAKSDKHPRDPYIVEPPSPPPSMKKPGLHSYSSAPPNVFTATPSRSQSMQSQYSRKDAAPPMARAATFNVGDGSRGSRMKKSMEFESESDTETPPVYAAHRTSSPGPREKRYHVSGGRTIPIPRPDHRDDEYVRARTPSPSPRSRLAPERGSGRSQRQYHADDREPVVIPIHPKMSPRETGHRSYDQVKWSPNYTPADVVYTSVPPNYRRDSDTNHRDYSYPSRSRETAYA
ncbi:hypothetical protein F5884DRAFT_202602 [Xylogone sp. PMI_703]|nr:hypothetical protein F5884DRAFT_202602 [Xylogone sp. PMI_703]